MRIYCYEYVQDFSQFDERALPAKECFYSSLTLSQTSPVFFVSALQVFYKKCGKR